MCRGVAQQRKARCRGHEASEQAGQEGKKTRRVCCSRGGRWTMASNAGKWLKREDYVLR